jgi:hypothetical protein
MLERALLHRRAEHRQAAFVEGLRRCFLAHPPNARRAPRLTAVGRGVPQSSIICDGGHEAWIDTHPLSSFYGRRYSLRYLLLGGSPRRRPARLRFGR